MKMRLRTIGVVFIILMAAWGSAHAQVVDIPDQQLRVAVYDALGIPTDASVTRAEMLQLTGLDVTDRGVENLSGLEFATNLTWLSIAYNPVTDLRPIAGLTKLDTLYMWATPVSNITPLANLTNLRSIHANYCRIVDISPLANLRNLEELSLVGNRITDVTPLANLVNLKSLYLEANLIMDHSPLDGLSLTTFVYDQTCNMPRLPLHERLENRNFPSLFTPWGFLPKNQPHLSEPEQMSQHDMYFCCMSMFHMELAKTSDGYLVRGDLEKSIQRRDEYLAHNPNMIFLTTLNAVLEGFETFPEDSPYWLRDDAGNILEAFGAGLVKLNHPDVQKRIVDQVVAISKCGLYDGIHFDLWSEGHNAGRGQLSGQVAILKAIRERVRDNFLILVNTNVYKAPASAPYVNGSFFESGLPGDAPSEGNWSVSNQLKDMADTISWAEQNFRSPQINALLGFGLGREPMDSPTNRRYMRAITTLNLTFSDGYFMYYLPGPDGGVDTGLFSGFYWYDFWDADLGHPVGPKSQLYDDRPGLYIREFTNGWAVYNHSGAPQVITLPEEVQGVASNLVNKEHALPNLDGEMYLRIKPKNPADVNGDGVVNIFDLTLVAQAIGTDGVGGDVNRDGVVNVFDLVLVANAF